MTTAKPIDLTKIDETAFWSKVHMTDTCWYWNGSRDPYGYGRVMIRGSKSRYFAHRVVLALFGIPLDTGLVIDHLCRNPSCVNPAHLEQVTNDENVARGQSHFGSAMRARAQGKCINGHELAVVGVYYAKTATICKQCASDKQRRVTARRRAALGWRTPGWDEQ